MRALLIAGTAMAGLLGAGAAQAAERVVERGPGVMRGWHSPKPMIHPTAPSVRPIHRPMPQVQHRAPRWGSKVQGRWWGGVNAPGGWSAYRSPVRGYALPTYWNTPRFYISDWSRYGLQQPQYGYNWVRYYDDAVLIDRRGSVYDSVGNVDWDVGDYPADQGYDDPVYATGGYAPQPAPAYRDDGGDYERRNYERRDNGVGGALAGAAVGGVAGALVAGKGDRVGGALIGGGVGAVTGYAIDKAEDRRRAPPASRGGYGAGYPQPGYAPGHAPAPVGPGDRWVSPDGGTTVVTSGGGYGGSTTIVTVHSAPVVTTTTTEIYEDHVTWSRPAPRKKMWKARRKMVCACR